MSLYKALERPLPKPRRDLSSYAAARVLEALLESILALEFLEKGYTRNAAGKAYQAWKALTGALLAVKRDQILERLASDEEKEWVKEKAIPRIPSSRLKPLARLVEEAGVQLYSLYTDRALLLHDYQYHGPDPAAELSKYPDPGEAARDIIQLLERLLEIIETIIRPWLVKENEWIREHEEAINMLREKLVKTR